ncbi:MAG: apolipoprotein N-acyltransferase [Nitrospinota bacterium]|nr:apolipoprotein N-acyltransferase [Nitrospinota bacterium]
MEKWIPWALAAASGVLLVVSYPPFGAGYVAWIALVPLMIALHDKQGIDSFYIALACGIIYFTGVMPWIYTVLTTYGHIWPPLAVILTFILILYLAVYTGLYGLILPAFGKTAEMLFLSPFIIVLLEYARGHFLTGLPWALIAHTQSYYPSVIQMALFTGTAGVTFLIVLVNSSIAYAFIRTRSGGFQPRSLAPAAVAITLAIINTVWGQANIRHVKNLDGKEINASIIQGNIDQDMKWDNKYRDTVIATYFTLSKSEAKKKPDLLVWPEASIPFFYGYDAMRTNFLNKLSESIDTPILFGGLGVEHSEDTGKNYYTNRAYLLNNGKVVGHYDKMHLVPFGEYVPLRKLLFFVNKITKALSSDTTPGDTASPLTINSIPLGSQICYEIIFAEPTRMFVRNGARLITNITNDAWFGKSGASAQHMASLPFRAVENRIAIIRSANTGISGFVSATGEISNTTELFKVATANETLKVPDKSGTFYTRFGDVFTLACALLLATAYIRVRRRN